MRDTLLFMGTVSGKALFMWGLTLFFIMVNIFLERKVCALIQDRVGPNRAHVFGLRLFGFILNFADTVKLVFKEDVVLPFVNRVYYLLAPLLIMTLALIGTAVVPFADDLTIGGLTIRMQVMDINVGFLFVLAVTSLSVYSLVLGGWGSNSKYPMFSAMRSSAQMISYEISMGLSLVGLVMVFGTLSMNDLVRGQGDLLFGFIPKWGVVVQPLGAILFCIAALAELNRNPFDLPEGESEIIGFHVEYSSMKFALFFMGEYASIFVASAVIATLFFGGWQIPWLTTDTIKAHSELVLRGAAAAVLGAAVGISLLLARFYRRRTYCWNDLRDKEPWILFTALAAIAFGAAAAIGASFYLHLGETAQSLLAFFLQVAAFVGKAFILCFTIIWIRWTLPRLRYDQLMALGWKIMLPLGIVNLFGTGLILLLRS